MITNSNSFLLTIRRPDGETSEFRIPLGVTVIGRGADAGLILDDRRVSNPHARLDCDGTQCSITDLESTNGTRLNGQDLAPNVATLIPDQAEIRIVGFHLFFRQIKVVEPTPIPVEVEEVLPVVLAAKAPPPVLHETLPPEEYTFSPGLTLHSQRLLDFLPDIYHTDFMSRFLALFESILIPIEWTIGNFDIFLTPGTAPQEFLPWLAGWLDLKAGPGWDESKQRQPLSKAHELYARRGTPGALKQVLYIYLGEKGDEPVIVDQARDLESFTFKVILPVKAGEINQDAVRQIIDEFKPVYTTYTLEFKM